VGSETAPSPTPSARRSRLSGKPLERVRDKKLINARPGPGRPPKAFDVAWHVDPASEAPPWTPARIAKFLAKYYETRCSMRKTCHRLDIPYRQAIAYRASNADFDDRLKWAERMYREYVRETFNERVLTDERHPANIIFDLKSRDPDYTPTPATPVVQIAVAIRDSVLAPRQLDAVDVKALPA
jgi:hypothetical protein